MEQNQNKNKGVAADCSTSSDDVERYFNSLPVGYRFAPSDDELIRYYLLRKINNEHLPPNRIYVRKRKPVVFFTSREKKYPNGSTPKRNAGELGYWEPTGTDEAILDGKKPMGFRKSLDYYEGKQRDGTKTNWKMHEYLLHQSLVPSGATARGKNPLQSKQLDEWVLCKIYNNKAEDKKNKNDEDGGTVNIAETEIPKADDVSTAQPLLCDNSLMISQEYENGYGSYLLPPLWSDPPQPVLDNVDNDPPPMNNTFNNNFAYNVQPIQICQPPSHYSNGFQPIYGRGDQVWNINSMQTSSMNDLFLMPTGQELIHGRGDQVWDINSIQTTTLNDHFYVPAEEPVFGCGNQVSNINYMVTADMNGYLLVIAEEPSPLLEPAAAEKSTREFDAQPSSSNQPMPVEGAYDHASSVHREEERQSSLFDMLQYFG
ncbi:hypothetical protein MANES_07G038365v8 [Manihot esculenta]|uniref:Uncharacterized protein n=1 Tax=Manihot esculenta TaxID=3983 RepID=A0ACB7HF25_MANES|nr:hypothetical protein MANES_07G038365v8 [Manihot esculenta]